MQAEDKNGIQHDIGHRPDHNSLHPHLCKALADDKLVHARCHQRKEGSAQIDGHIGQRIGKGCLSGAKPPEQLFPHAQYEDREDQGHDRQHQKAVRKDLSCSLFILLSQADAHKRRAAYPHQNSEGRNQCYNGTADAYTGQSHFSDLWDVSYVHTVYNTVKYTDELCQHGWQCQTKDQPPYVIGV